MKRTDGGGPRWGSALLGWLVAVAVGAVLSPILRLLYGLVSHPPVDRAEFTTTVVAISLVAGFLAYLVGGYVAGKFAGVSGGLNGAMTAVFGLLAGLVLAGVLSAFGLIFSEAAALPPAGFGLSGAALISGLVLFLVNLLGGYVGGKLGEPPYR